MTAMSESVEEMGCKGVVTRVTDHSLLDWEVLVDRVMRAKEEESELRWYGEEV